MERVMRYRYTDNVTERGVEITLEQYVEEKKTPSGAWVRRYWGPEWWEGDKRFVLDGNGKRLCYQTKELAWKSFLLRKRRQVFHADVTLKRASFLLSQVGESSAPDTSLSLGKPEFWEKYTFD